MLIVLAHPRDPGACALLERWGPRARLLGPRDLSLPGWRHYVGASGEEWAVASGERVRVAEIEGVVTRLPQVREENLGHIAAEDRAYVATEMNAFLIAWLSRLGCPVLNRPSASSLMGPSLSHERWLLLAARAGLSLASRRLTAPDVEPPPPAALVSVVGSRWFGAVEPPLGAQAVGLARLAGVELLTVRFLAPTAGAPFASADLGVDVSGPEIADALLARLEGAARV